jgi:hypothetical protein
MHTARYGTFEIEIPVPFSSPVNNAPTLHYEPTLDIGSSSIGKFRKYVLVT